LETELLEVDQRLNSRLIRIGIIFSEDFEAATIDFNLVDHGDMKALQFDFAVKSGRQSTDYASAKDGFGASNYKSRHSRSDSETNEGDDADPLPQPPSTGLLWSTDWGRRNGRQFNISPSYPPSGPGIRCKNDQKGLVYEGKYYGEGLKARAKPDSQSFDSLLSWRPVKPASWRVRSAKAKLRTEGHSQIVVSAMVEVDVVANLTLLDNMIGGISLVAALGHAQVAGGKEQ
jgi:hypothetical protein